MAVQSTKTIGSGVNSFRKIVATQLSDVPAAGAFLGDELIVLQPSPAKYDLVATVGDVKSWVQAGVSGVGYKTTFGGTNTLALGTKTISGGIVVTANSRIIATKKGVPAFAIGELYISARTVGAAGVGAFTADARLAASGAVVTTDLSDFDWIIQEPNP